MKKNENLILRHAPLAALAAATLLALTACSTQTAGEAGEELIEGELGTEIAMGPLESSCTTPDDPKTGATFTCSATTESGDTLEFVGIMEADDKILVGASNVIFVEDLDFLEGDAVTTGAENFEVDPSTLTVDCPDENTLVVDDQVTCELTDSSDGATYDLTVTLEPFVAGEGFSGWEFSLGDQTN